MASGCNLVQRACFKRLPLSGQLDPYLTFVVHIPATGNQAGFQALDRRVSLLDSSIIFDKSLERRLRDLGCVGSKSHCCA